MFMGTKRVKEVQASMEVYIMLYLAGKIVTVYESITLKYDVKS